ncbi:MAG TPA: creatininase family protein [Geminicoccaceae bacterium]|nr:creatininase family protein [Geminicoccaceae bacterium]
MSKTLPGWWQDLPTTEFRALDPEAAVAVLPVAAIEQHGPHLPVAVDALINQGIVRRTLELLPAGAPVLVLPMTAVGKSDEHLAFPGTLTLSAETLGRVWLEIGESVRRAGVRKLVFLNSHGGQPQVMQIVARELRVRHAMLAVACSWFGFGVPDGLFDAREVRHGIHGGAIETAMMLALRPDLVRMDAAREFVPASVGMEEEFPRLLSLGFAGFGWQTQDLHPAGACGDATRATAEAGRRCIDHAAAAFAELLLETVRFPLARLARTPEAGREDR